jgi:hypothetical protein
MSQWIIFGSKAAKEKTLLFKLVKRMTHRSKGVKKTLEPVIVV